MKLDLMYKKIKTELEKIYDKREANNIADMVIENITGMNRIERLIKKEIILNDEQITKAEKYLNELMVHRPIQYVLHEAWFSRIKFFVDENVLIPRPETEELVEWIISDTDKTKQISILDIGTGSGCIAIALKKKLPQTIIHALDISDPAIQIAKRNANENNAEIIFHKTNILDEEEWKSLQQFDIIVSNPPYIKTTEAKEMHKNVLNFEPHLALFTQDDDALIFYRKIAAFANTHLHAGGKLYFEINELYPQEVAGILSEAGFKNTSLKKDMHGKYRMICAWK